MSKLTSATSLQVVWRARLVLACLVLIGLCFHQAPGKIVPDTKLDLTAGPGGFLLRALHLWDPQGAFGQLQNQAYGYLLPMGPFHWLLDWLTVPDWVTQRMWWSVVLCVAFVGVWKLSNALDLGAPWTRFAAALFYALCPRMLGEVSITSVEVWPMAMAPWVLLPLVTPKARSGWWRVGWSAVAFGLVGGVNAVATGATLVLPALWLLTRRLDRTTLKVAIGWFGCVAAVSVWWLVPLLLLGRYSPPFLDWIEDAGVTTGTASVFEAFRGTSHWLNFLSASGGPSWPASWLYVTQPALILSTTAVALLGLAGLAMPSLRHRGFLQLSLVAGLLLVTLGHAGAGGSPFAPQLQDLLDGPLAALRNTHKFELVVRLPLVLAAAHAISRMADWVAERGVQRRLVPGLVACLILSIAVPAILGQLPRKEGYQAIPAHWREAAAWLDKQPTNGTVLVVPAASFADFTWGSTKDEPFQALLKRPMAVRDAVPLGSAGTTRWLDEVERRLSSGVGDAALRQTLSRGGVRYLVVRNDLRVDAQSSPPIAVHETLSESGIGRVAFFGPPTGSSIERPGVTLDGHSRLPYPSVEIFDVGETSPARLIPQSQLVQVRGAAEDVPAVLAQLGGNHEAVTTSDLPAGLERAGLENLPLVQTDGMQRREVAVGRPADNYSPVLSADDPGRQKRRTLGYEVDPAAPQTTRTWSGGVVAVRASSSAADPDATLRTGPGNGPFAAVDGDPASRWISGTFGRSGGEWLELAFPAARAVDGLRIQFSRAAPTTEPVRTLKVETDSGSLTTVVAPTDKPQSIPVPPGLTQRLRVGVGVTDGKNPNGVSIAELTLPGLEPVSRLALPSTDEPTAIVLRNQQPGRSQCLHVGTRPLCRPGAGRDSEEPTGLRRSVDLRSPGGSGRGPRQGAGSFQVKGTALPKDGTALERLLTVPGAITATASSRSISAPEGRPGAVVDQDLGTGWIAGVDDLSPTLTLTWPTARTVTGLQFLADRYLAASVPIRMTARFGGGPPVPLTVDGEGYARFSSRAVRTIELTFGETRPLTDYDAATGYPRQAPVGMSEIRVLGADDLRKKLNPAGRTGAPCGYGPQVQVNGVQTPTQLTATIGDVLSGRPVSFSSCGRALASLPDGRSNLDVLAANGFVPVTAAFTKPRPSQPAARIERVEVWRPNPAELKLEAPATSTQSVLTVTQNFNHGWEAYDSRGRRLVSIRINGWQQGWLVPPGAEQVVTARFVPDRTYQTGLVAGLAALVLVVALAVLIRRRARHSAHRLREGRRMPAWLVTGVAAIAGTVLSGWIGLAVVAVAAVLAWLLSGRIKLVLALVAGVVLLAAVLAAAQPWTDGGAGLDSGVVQASVLLGCALAVFSRPVGETS